MRPARATLAGMLLVVGCSGRGTVDRELNGEVVDVPAGMPTGAAGTGAGGTGASAGTSVPVGGTTSPNPVPVNPSMPEPAVTEQVGRCGEIVPVLAGCSDEAPPDSFEPDLQWSWNGQEGRRNSQVTPLVASLTDDDGDGDVDVADTPDIVVVVSFQGDARIVVLDGATGAVHFQISEPVKSDATPAIGDIDGDGLVEIVTLTREMDWREGRLVAFENDGTLAWHGDLLVEPARPISIDESNLALADVDADGDVEILVDTSLFDHEGHLLWKAPLVGPWWAAPTAADLDGDGLLEIVLGQAAYHADGSEYFVNDEIAAGYPHVADMDDDCEPEILVTSQSGISMLEGDGTTIFANLTPIELTVSASIPWFRPAAIHDFDGDGAPEFAVSAGSQYTVYKANATPVWTAAVADPSGAAGGTAFDFLGDGTAEAMYADEFNMFIYGPNGVPVYTVTRSSGTAIEYPVVADVDNDGSAEIIVVSDDVNGGEASPTVQVFRDKEDRWIRARGIWNQHTYHVTNVNDDGTIPQREVAHWKALNTFRTNAQIETGVLCLPQGPI